MNEGKFVDSSKEILEESNALDTITEIAEAVIDTFMQEGIKDFPLLSSFRALFKVREKILERKLRLFYEEVGYTEQKFKDNFLKKCQLEPAYKIKVGEHIINALDKFDQILKAEAFGKLFASYLSAKIDYQEFTLYSYALDRIDFQNIELLKEFYTSNFSKAKEYLLQNFAFAGLVKLRSVNWRNITSEESIFETNDFGEKFLRILGLL